jgi:tRNA threonylcarbamoyladenosine biosynthesis protein TsaE
MEIRIDNIENIRQSAREFVSQIDDRRVFAFYGKMGAGKTTFIKAICEELGVKDVITSPTFAIVNEYRTPSKPPRGEACGAAVLPRGGDRGGAVIFHFDFYRIKKIEEVYDMGYEDYFYSGALCFIEWPELIEDLLPDDAVRVTITEQEDGSRTVMF